MVLSLFVNGVLDIGFGVGWWVVKKVGSSIYDLGSNLFYEKVVRSSVDDKEKMEKLIELLEHDLVEIKHNQEIILHKLDVDDGKVIHEGNVIIDPL